MDKTLKAICSVAGLCSLSVLGCGDSEDKGPAKSSGVESGKQLSALTDDDVSKLCSWGNQQAASIDISEKQICTWVSARFAKDEASCNSLVSQCLKAGSDYNPDDVDDSENCDVQEASNVDDACNATVGEVEACVKAVVISFENEFSSATCRDAGTTTTSSEQPAACRTLQSKCPGVLDDVGVGLPDLSEFESDFESGDETE